MEFRTYLYVPPAEKVAAEALGAVWDLAVRKLYVPEGMESDPFRAWLPLVVEEEDKLRINGPLFVAESTTTCGSCGQSALVVALATEMLDECGEPFICNLLEVQELPSDLSSLLAGRYPSFKRDSPKFGEAPYLMNHCGCGAPLEDWDLHAEFDGSFVPTSPEAGTAIVLRQIPTSGPLILKANYSLPTDDYIGPYAARESL